MDSMILAFLLLVSIINLTVIIVTLFRIRNIYRQFQEFITPVDDKQGSPLFQLTDAISQVFSRTLIAQAKTIFMAKESGIVRGQNRVDQDIADDMLSQANPLIAGILSQFPQLKKTLTRNPALIDYAVSKLAGKLPVVSDHTTGDLSTSNNHKSEQVKFDL